MGAWGAGNFEKDDASDWVYDFEENPTANFIEESLQTVTEIGNEYLEAHQCCRALAAAEVIAALKNAPHPKLPDEVKELLNKEKIAVDQNLISLALNAVGRINRDSELKELWEEAGASEWQAELSNLEARLMQP